MGKPVGKPRGKKVSNESVIIRHEEPSEKSAAFPAKGLSGKAMTAIEDHVRKHIGANSGVLHELISEGIHLDVLPVGPSKKRPFTSFVTMGMSAVPMTRPAGDRGPRYAELMVVLPPEWPIDFDAISSDEDRYYWPIEWLKNLARIPSDYDTFLDVGHTIPNGDPPERLNAQVGFIGWMVFPPIVLPDAFGKLRSGAKTVQFLQIVPLFREEMEFKLSDGVEALCARLDGLDPIRIADPARPNACAKAARGTKKR